MFLTHVVKCALLGSFQQRINLFGGIVMHIAASKLFRVLGYVPREGIRGRSSDPRIIHIKSSTPALAFAPGS
jgi:hypothetical protein